MTNRPKWMILGNAVRIIHRGGARGYVEIIGPGRAIPTAVSGSNTPDPGTPADMVLSGLEVFASNPAQMGVYITSGSYRIGGTQYYYLATGNTMTMSATSQATMGMTIDGDPLVMGSGYDFHSIDASPSEGYSRFDTFAIGADGTIDYVKGATSSQWSEPLRPNIPNNHVQVGHYILVIGGDTTITEDRINANYRERQTAQLNMWPDTNDSIGWEQTTKTVWWEILDQYESRYSRPRTLLFTLELGTGGVGAAGQSSYSVQTNGSLGTITYYRGSTSQDEVVPVITGTIAVGDGSGNGITGICVITLLGADGEPIQP
jgi:hypothetical protein